MPRAYYSDCALAFQNKSKEENFGELMINDQSDASELQRNTWVEEINILKRELIQFSEGYVIFEYTIPRIGRRIDNVIIYSNKKTTQKYHSFYK